MASSQPILSVLIPTYNWPVRRLLLALTGELKSGGRTEDVQIIVGDDGSSDLAVLHDNKSAVKDHADLVELVVQEKNTGRSAVRNTLLAASRGRFILFLDADVIPDSPTFLARYLAHCSIGDHVVCGGLSYIQCTVEQRKAHSLYIRYSSKAGALSVAERNRIAWKWIFTSNIMVSRGAMVHTPFDERYRGYGYEDLDWAVRLGALYPIVHIDNTVTHLGLQTKAQMHRKMVESTDNFLVFQKLHPSHACVMPIGRYARAFARLPRPVISLLIHCARWAFNIRVDGISLVSFQLEKALLAAHRMTLVPTRNS